jgi:c-di-GMP-binding flagellar brake protein YcgR
MRTSNQAARSLFGGTAETERRASIRRPCKVQISYRASADPAEASWARGTVLDISATGICLLLNEASEPGTLLTVVLPSAAVRNGRRLLRARVVHVTTDPGNGSIHGCAVVGSKLSDEELQTLPG